MSLLQFFFYRGLQNRGPPDRFGLKIEDQINVCNRKIEDNRQNRGLLDRFWTKNRGLTGPISKLVVFYRKNLYNLSCRK